MMKISTRSRYGLRALVELAAAGDGEAVSLRSIAGKHGMSEYYLEQLFAPLKKAGIITSMRGPRGGYRLVRAADSVTAAEVIRVLEGTFSPVDCLEDVAAVCASANCENCSTKPVWEKLYAGINEVLHTIRLSDLI